MDTTGLSRSEIRQIEQVLLAAACVLGRAAGASLPLLVDIWLVP